MGRHVLHTCSLAPSEMELLGTVVPAHLLGWMGERMDALLCSAADTALPNYKQ